MEPLTLSLMDGSSQLKKVENPINKNGTINFKVKFLDGEAEDKRVVCNKCGFSAHVEVDEDERPVILEP
ncbi:hypothetical protein HS1_000909 [Candidatus Desulfofervidus auxilii]|uniref:Uncharacterized protein n=1 Tax=Desulfofervidus auxilii TaxID=1621989 RepID=A0A7U4THZ9_DESA2|nr:hypothetical protein HS1_000909 [Candidatus Desulfofervidus auxilii]